jgi:ubiquinone/menaquinone biosynthesis C-methylase UbiE
MAPRHERTHDMSQPMSGAGPVPKAVSGQATVIRWAVPENLLASPAVEIRNKFAERLAELPANQLVESYVYLSFREMNALVAKAYRLLGIDGLRGTGMELGAGCGLLSATVARASQVDRIYALEVVEGMVSKVIPKVAAAVLGNSLDKVIPVFGSFDDICLPDESIDFITEIDSLHHSDDLGKTMQSAARVLKRGGKMLCFDRVHPDTLSDTEVEQMLSLVYPKSFLVKYGYPADIRFTRRENGEHEYRLREWRMAFEGAGLRLVQLKPFVHHPRMALAVKGILSTLPRSLTANIYQTPNATLRTTLDWASAALTSRFKRTAFGPPVLAPKTTTVFLLEKDN